MKKYITPATRWAEIEEACIIAASKDPDSLNDYEEGNALTKECVPITSKNLWDSEW